VTQDKVSWVHDRLIDRNRPIHHYFNDAAPILADVCRQMAERFQQGGRLLAFGQGPFATDAQHVAVEFVHPSIVGKRALPALDLSLAYDVWVRALLEPTDMVMGFGPPQGDLAIDTTVKWARSQGALALSMPGIAGEHSLPIGPFDGFLHQEIIKLMYHTLWETVHVFFEHRELGHTMGAAGFLYPGLGTARQDTASIVEDVAASIRAKAQENLRLREWFAEEQSSKVVDVILAIAERVHHGGQVILFGNGGSATDANDWAMHLTALTRPVPAISLAIEPAVLSAVANDVGAEVIFLRQLLAHARPQDVAVAISTSGGSRNILVALEEARRLGLLTVALLGYDGGEVVRRGAADFALVVSSDSVHRIQEVQASAYHVICEGLREGFQ